MENEWLYIEIFFIVLVLILIVCIVKIAPWFKQLISGEIVVKSPTAMYCRDHPEEFSIEHTYAIMKSPMGQNILKKNRKRIITFICLWGVSMLAIYFSPQWSQWVGKWIPFVTNPIFEAVCGAVFMVGAFILYLKFMTTEDRKVWICPHCKKPLMRIQLSKKESRRYQDNPKAIFIRHRWGRRNLLLVADHCPYCGKSYLDNNNDILHDEAGTIKG